MNRTKLPILFVCIFLFSGAAYCQVPEFTEMTRIRSACRALLLSDTAYATEQSYRLTDDVRYNTDGPGYFKSLTAEGSWKDINYHSELRGAWVTSWHMYRIMLLCRSYYKNHDAAYLAAVHRALKYWMTNDFQSSNWWQNQINTPYTFSSLMLMLDKDATPEELAYLDTVLVKRIPQKAPTGQNLIWQLDNQARVALIHQQYTGLTDVIRKMQGVINVSTGEGIQPDYSFHQHGAMLQFGNYGFHFVNSLLFWMTVTANTSLAFSADKQQMIFNYCSQGLRWTIYKRAMDAAAIGRQFRENFDTKRGQYLYNDFNLLRSFDKNYAGKYNLDGFAYPGEKAAPLNGNKSFWRSDYMIELAANKYMMSVKTHGMFVKKVESLNSENLKGSFLNDGLTMIRSSGKEYKNIEAIWNWTMLPGITCDTTIDPAAAETFASSNTSDFVGQLSDSTSGVSAMAYNRLNIQAHKSYFFTDGMMIALGADITSANSKNLVTTVNQRLTNHQALFKGIDANGASWLWHDGIAYVFPDKKEQVKTTIEYKHGNWITVDKGSGDKPVADSVLTAYIPHADNSNYIYIVKPACNLADAKQLAKQGPVELIANTGALQAIKTGSKTMVVFYAAGLCKARDVSIEVDKPCILMCRQVKNQTQLWVSDPTRKLQEIHITIGGRSVTVNLPANEYAGSAAHVVLK